MLDHLKRFFNATEKEEVKMNETTEQEVTAALVTEQVSANLSEALAAATELNASQATAIAELTTKYETLQATLAEIESAKANLVAEQHAAKLQLRKEKVESLIGTVKAPALLSATESLEDTAFDAVLAAMIASVEQESKSDLFREIGASGSADALNVEEDAVARLAAKIDAQFKPK